MPDMVEREKERRTKSERELDKLGEGSSSNTKVKPKPKPKKTKPAVEKAGVGRDFASENQKRLAADLDERIRAARAAGNQDLVNKYTARKKALLEL